MFRVRVVLYIEGLSRFASGAGKSNPCANGLLSFRSFGYILLSYRQLWGWYNRRELRTLLVLVESIFLFFFLRERKRINRTKFIAALLYRSWKNNRCIHFLISHRTKYSQATWQSLPGKLFISLSLLVTPGSIIALRDATFFSRETNGRTVRAVRLIAATTSFLSLSLSCKYTSLALLLFYTSSSSLLFVVVAVFHQLFRTQRKREPTTAAL